MEFISFPVMDEDISDEELLRNVEHLERTSQQEGGGALNREGYFNFKLTQFKEKKAKNYGIKRNSYHLKLQNPQDTFPIGHGNVIRAFEEGLANAIKDLIRGLPDHDRIQIYLGSNRLRNAHTSASVSVEQWRDPLGASRQVLHNISNLLSLNENYEINDTLQLDVTHITMPPPGSGSLKGKRKRCCLGSDNYGELLRSKRSIIRINNDDELCCARAIIMAKAVADDDERLKLIKDYRSNL